MQPAPAPQKKASFFKRLSIGNNASAQVRQAEPSGRHGNEVADTRETVEQMEEHRMPSGSNSPQNVDRSKKKDRRMFGRDRGGNRSNQSTPPPSHTPPTRPSQTPVAAQFQRSIPIFPELDSNYGSPYPSFPTPNPYASLQHAQPSSFAQSGPYPSFSQPQAHHQPPQPMVAQPQPQQFKPFRTPSQNRAPVHPALASSSSPPPHSPQTSQGGSHTGHGGSLTGHGQRSPVDLQPGMSFPPVPLGAAGEARAGSSGTRDNAMRSMGKTRDDGKAKTTPLNPAPRTSSRSYGDLRSPPPPSQSIALPVPPMPGAAGAIPNGTGRENGRSTSGRPIPPHLIIPSDPRQPRQDAQSFTQDRSVHEAPHSRAPPTRPIPQLEAIQDAEPRQSSFPAEAPPAYTPSPVSEPKQEQMMRQNQAMNLPPGAMAPEASQTNGSGSRLAPGVDMSQTQNERLRTPERPRRPPSPPTRTPPRPSPSTPSKSSPVIPTHLAGSLPPGASASAQMSEASKYKMSFAAKMQSKPSTPTPTSASKPSVRTEGPDPRASLATLGSLGSAGSPLDGSPRRPLPRPPSTSEPMAGQGQSPARAQPPARAASYQTPSRNGAPEGMVGAALSSFPTQDKVSHEARRLDEERERERKIGEKAKAEAEWARRRMISEEREREKERERREVEQQERERQEQDRARERKMERERENSERERQRQASERERDRERQNSERERQRQISEKEKEMEARHRQPPPPRAVSDDIYLSAFPQPPTTTRAPTPPQPNSKLAPPNGKASLEFEFPRSPTLPPLHDPRKDPAPGSSPLASPAVSPGAGLGQSHEHDPISRWAGAESTPLVGQQLPPRGSSAQQAQQQQNRRIVSSPLSGGTSPRITSPLGMTNSRFPHTQAESSTPRSVSQPMSFKSQIPHSSSIPTLPPLMPSEPLPPPRVRGARPRATITFVLAFSSIQSVLMPYLTINSFLSLVGASETIRRRFTGEMVGRWVMREWGMNVAKEKGGEGGSGGWPNLTVWEGFLESLLHNPASFSTYPTQWHGLLQHLCLSHTLVVLHLRSLPPQLFPNAAPMPFEDDMSVLAPNLPFSVSSNSLASRDGYRSLSRMNGGNGSDAGSTTGASGQRGRMLKNEKLVEIVMPQPLATQPRDESPVAGPYSSRPGSAAGKARRRRDSIGSLASVANTPFGRNRVGSSSAASISDMPLYNPAQPVPSGKASLPPVSYPSAKRYGFKRHGDPTRSRSSMAESNSRPGSIFSVQSSPSMMMNSRLWSNAPPVPGLPAGLPMPPPIGGFGGSRGSLSSSSDLGRSSRRSDYGGNSPVDATGRRDMYTPSPVMKRIEPAFDKPIPYTLSRAPLLRVFVPLSESVPRWPSAEGAGAAVKELEKCGSIKRLRLGDLVVNTAIKAPKTTEHVLIFVPWSKHLLLPLSYQFSPSGHLPSTLNALLLPPSYYFTFLSSPPQVIYLDLTPFGQDALPSLRLAYDRRDVTVASGARVSAKRYLHVAGFEIRPGQGTDPAWEGFVSLEGEGTAEGKVEMERRLVGDRSGQAVLGSWEVVREKSMVGNVWLRLVKPLQVKEVP